MTTIDQAVAAMQAASEPAPAPTVPAPSKTPTAPTPEASDAPSDAPTAPLLATPAPVPDDTSELLARLEARRVERLAKRAPEPSPIDSKIAVLEAELARLSRAPSAPDFASLVRQHGEVEAMRMVGIDPLEYYNRFKEIAKDPTSFTRKQAAEAERLRLEKIEEGLTNITKTEQQRIEREQQRSVQAQWHDYSVMVADPKSETPLLAKLDRAELLDRTQRKIDWLQANDYDVEQIDDRMLAKIVEADMRKLRDLLAGTDASATSPSTPGSTDGASTEPVTATTLSNDLASQSTGRPKPLSEKQRLAAAIAVMEKMNSA